MMNVAFAQESGLQISRQNVSKPAFLDSIKSQFIYHETAACVDNRWLNYYMNEDLFQQMEQDLEIVAEQDSIVYDLSTDLLKKRLLYLDAKSAFNISYNPHLEQSIKYYLKNRKKSFERLIGMSEYYFPFFEEALSKYNLPLEIKYLAIVESALNPKAVSRMGATGLWQFMYGTGKQYKLEINTFVDERSDLLKSTEAACQYMSNMYQIFGEWDLVLASYNAGPGNVSKAIRRSGGKQNYWNIRPYLPRETQGYVPAFLATMYVYEFHKEHGFEPQKFAYNPVLTDTLVVKNKVTFKQLADLLDLTIEEIQFLNPSYKRDFIPYQTDKNHFVRLPLDKVAVMTSNESLIYAYINADFSKAEQYQEEQYVEQNIDYYKVKKGDNLGKIANKYKVTVSDLKKWNHLKNNNLAIGKKLKIESFKKVKVSEKTPQLVVTEKVEKAIESEISISETLPTEEENQQTIETTTLENEETTETEIVEETSEKIQDKVTEKEKLIHKVQKGESLFLISKQYQVPIEDLKKWNKIEDNKINNGMELFIFSTKKQINDQDESPNKSEKQYKTYIVQKGDSLYSISQKNNGITITDLKKWNALRNNDIKPGMKLIVQKP